MSRLEASQHAHRFPSPQGGGGRRAVASFGKLAASVLALILAISTAVAETTTVRILFLDRAGDPFYAHRESYGGIYDATRQPALAGAELGIKDSKIVGRAIGATFELIHETISEGGDAAAFTGALIARHAPAAVILDLPLADVEAVATRRDGPVLFNIRHRDTGLRKRTCNSHLFHVLPSDAMLHDGLAQYLRLMGWDEVLVLASAGEADMAEARSFQRSAAKFGLSIADTRSYAAGSDPRQRDQNSVRLLTGGVDYDAVFVADESREFALSLPYRTFSPRPVVGATGLVASAWHRNWERHGAPQLNRRFLKSAGRTMSDEDWAAWAAVRAIVEARVRDQATPLSEALLNPGLTLELYKGFPGSFRPWDRQLRQSILLGTSDAVIALAPVEGALHQFNTLDTLGLDEPEFSCP